MAHSNWNLFYDRVDKCVKSVATNHARKQGAKESVYGSVNYFLRMLEWQLNRTATGLNDITPIGLGIRDKLIQYTCPPVLDERKSYRDNLIGNAMNSTICLAFFIYKSQLKEKV